MVDLQYSWAKVDMSKMLCNGARRCTFRGVRVEWTDFFSIAFDQVVQKVQVNLVCLLFVRVDHRMSYLCSVSREKQGSFVDQNTFWERNLVDQLDGLQMTSGAMWETSIRLRAGWRLELTREKDRNKSIWEISIWKMVDENLVSYGK